MASTKKKKRSSAKRYSKAFKMKVCQEYLSGNYTKVDLLRKYNIRYRSAIQTWMRTFGIRDKYVVVPNTDQQIIVMPSIANKKPDEADLEKRIKQLEKALEEAKLESAANSKVIEIAEREFNIDIRKKSVTKPSKK